MDQNTIKLFGSKESDEWGTPQKLFEELNKEFNFNLDVCASQHNTKCDKYFTLEDDALKQDWKGRIFCNPPYSKVKEFLQKAERERGNYEIICFLTFANTDTNWFHDYCLGKAEIRFIKGRLKFTSEINKKGNSAMRPSILIIFRGGKCDS
jgi:phage N-6-adenine-methyltransferase